MSTFAKTYDNVLNQITQRYFPHNNLLKLKTLRLKAKCYQQFSKMPIQYYECFNRTQLTIQEESNTFIKNYDFIENEYQKCDKACVASFPQKDLETTKCSEVCGKAYSKSTFQLYEAFYKKHLQTEPEYRKINKKR